MLDRAAVTSNPRSQRLMATRDDFSFMLHVGCGLAGWLWNHVLSLLRDPSGRSSSSKVTLFSGQRKRAHRSGTAHTLLNLTLKVCGTTPYIPRGQVCHPWAGKPRPKSRGSGQRRAMPSQGGQTVREAVTYTPHNAPSPTAQFCWLPYGQVLPHPF